MKRREFVAITATIPVLAPAVAEAGLDAKQYQIQLPRDTATKMAWAASFYHHMPEVKKRVDKYIDKTISYFYTPRKNKFEEKLVRLKYGDVSIRPLVWDYFVKGEFCIYTTENEGVYYNTFPENLTIKRTAISGELAIYDFRGFESVLLPKETTFVARRESPYDLRGTSLLEPYFRDFMIHGDHDFVSCGPLCQAVFENECMAAVEKISKQMANA